MASLLDRMIRAAKLDVHLYEEVEADTTALSQALGVVLVSSIAAGIGAVGQMGFGGLVLNSIVALASWFLWALIIYLIGARLLPEPGTSSNVGELLRTTGFAAAPGVIRIVGIVPGLRVLSIIVASIWMLVAMIIAVRQALDYTSTWRTVGVCLIGWIASALLISPFLGMMGPEQAGP